MKIIRWKVRLSLAVASSCYLPISATFSADVSSSIQAVPHSVARLEPHSRTWQRVTSEATAQGPVTVTNTFVELQTGLAFSNPQPGALEVSNPGFETANNH